MWYKGTQAEMEAIIGIINSNAGVPTGGNITWDIPRQTVNSGIYAVLVPNKEWNGRTPEQLKAQVSATEYEMVEIL